MQLKHATHSNVFFSYKLEKKLLSGVFSIPLDTTEKSAAVIRGCCSAEPRDADTFPDIHSNTHTANAEQPTGTKLNNSDKHTNLVLLRKRKERWKTSPGAPTFLI